MLELKKKGEISAIDAAVGTQMGYRRGNRLGTDEAN